MGRSPITAAMKASYFKQLAVEGKLPKSFVDKYSSDPEKFFIATPELKAQYSSRFSDIPLESVGVYTYLTDRVGVGLKQLMAGNRKWNLGLLGRGDLMSLSTLATEVTGIPLAHEVENEAVKKILDF
jgi:hypothetical protein